MNSATFSGWLVPQAGWLAYATGRPDWLAQWLAGHLAGCAAGWAQPANQLELEGATY